MRSRGRGSFDDLSMKKKKMEEMHWFSTKIEIMIQGENSSLKKVFNCLMCLLSVFNARKYASNF